jgi:hypothetical protein
MLNHYKRRGQKYIDMWECEFKKQKNDKHLQRFCREYQPEFTRAYLYKPVTQKDILNSIKEDKLFGLAEVTLVKCPRFL